jgi:hypothetical protein
MTICKQDLLQKTFVHYGAYCFDIERFQPVRNIGWNKPSGGMWCSFERSPNNWARWCKNEWFRTNRLDQSFKVKIKSSARILVITSVDELLYLPVQNDTVSPFNIKPDFEKIAKGYDGFLFDLSSDPRLYSGLYGWDCDSLLIFNPDAFMYKYKWGEDKWN